MAVAEATEPFSWEELIRFYAQAGVDQAVGDEPVDRFAEAVAMKAAAQAASQHNAASRTANSEHPSAQQRQTIERKAAAPQANSPASGPAPASAPAAVIDPDILLQQAKSLAASAQSLTDLHQMMEGFDGCRLKFTAKNICFADGDPMADLMVIGDTPGRDDDLEGIPFVGPPGQMLNRILAAIGLKREQAYLANTLPWRPPGNRPATPLEIDLCRPFLDRQIELVSPKIIVALGDPAAKVLTGSREPIYKMRGIWHEYTAPSGLKIAVMPSLHPDYLLRTPAQKRFAWEDWLAVKHRLNQTN